MILSTEDFEWRGDVWHRFRVIWDEMSRRLNADVDLVAPHWNVQVVVPDTPIAKVYFSQEAWRDAGPDATGVDLWLVYPRDVPGIPVVSTQMWFDLATRQLAPAAWRSDGTADWGGFPRAARATLRTLLDAELPTRDPLPPGTPGAAPPGPPSTYGRLRRSRRRS